MPGDFGGEPLDKPAANLALPVELLPGRGQFAPLEIVWTSELGAPLPMRKPRKKK